MQSFVSIDYFATKEGLLFLFSKSLDISSFSKFPTFQQILYKYFCEAGKENCLSLTLISAADDGGQQVSQFQPS
ncbi:MAG TPA: hypothetical protein V6D18_10655 [Thermosynechococcaceae cyanobacterium]